MGALRTFLIKHPALVWLLGFKLVATRPLRRASISLRAPQAAANSTGCYAICPTMPASFCFQALFSSFAMRSHPNVLPASAMWLPATPSTFWPGSRKTIRNSPSRKAASTPRASLRVIPIARLASRNAAISALSQATAQRQRQRRRLRRCAFPQAWRGRVLLGLRLRRGRQHRSGLGRSRAGRAHAPVQRERHQLFLPADAADRTPAGAQTALWRLGRRL